MNHFTFSSASQLTQLIETSSKGQKFGEHVVTCQHLDELEAIESTYVLFGIPTITVNSEAVEISSIDMFQVILQPLLNIQNNEFNDGANLIVLGEIDAQSILKEIGNSAINSEEIEKYKSLETEITTNICTAIIKAGKIPIAIGGDYQNTCSIVKGCVMTEDSSVNLLNLSTRFNLKFNKNDLQNNKCLENLNLDYYHSFGLHKNHVTQEELKLMKNCKKIGFKYYEDCLHLTTLDKCVKFKNAIDFLKGQHGFSLNLDSIQGMSSSCEASSGFSVRDLRTFMIMLKKAKIKFLHFNGFEKGRENSIGNTLSYLISDFIRVEN